MCFDGGLGSSPLARGTHAVVVAEVGGVGLIPARAGNTPASRYSGQLWGAHLRSRGEHFLYSALITIGRGSSPLARGTRWPGFRQRLCQGLIPARAGNTKVTVKSDSEDRAHPRSRGEHPERRYRKAPKPGSSPLARGTHVARLVHPAARGLIPARAGNTFLIRRRRNGIGAHPRSRGEHRLATDSNGQYLGSSPLARGTRRLRGSAGHDRGLIPARAGNTRNSGTHSVNARAHPRSRGEHSGVFPLICRIQGSSPLARGTPYRDKIATNLNGLIPARAGNTSL